MVKKCIKCNKQPIYNFSGEKSGIYCDEHKLIDMIDVIHKTCIYEGCDTRPSYNLAGKKQGIYCFKHKLVDMINVKNKTCIYEGCDTRPSYNLAGKKQGIYCVTHKLNDMINIVSKTCLECDKIPNFNVKGEKNGLYCVKHKKDGMIDVKHIFCLECDTQANFNVKGEKNGLYCVKHKKDGMIDVKNKTCLECDTQANFNVKGEKKGLYCVDHKKDGMIDIRNKTCIYEGCDTRPSYNLAGEKLGIYCDKHKLDAMIDVIHKTCKSDWCLSIPRNKKYDGYCLFCYINLFPEKPVSRNYKTKEYAVVEFVKTKFTDFDFVADKKISGGCSRRRPDLFLDMLYQIIIIEIDENQHTDYNCSCQNKRLMELSQDLGHRPIVFIRFNPDDYKKDGKNITSCWGQNKNGICVVKKSKQKEWIERLNTLEEQIKYWTCPENFTDKTIETIHLYYDM